MTRLAVNMLSARIDGPNGPHTYNYLRYAPLGDGRFGTTSTTAFMIDINGEQEDPNWADALLEAGRGEVTTPRRERFPVTFRLADEGEREQALARINEIRPVYGTRSDPAEVRIILAEIGPT